MNLLELSALIQDEKKCEEYLRSVGILKNFTRCLKCNSEKIGRVRRHRWKCYDCNYEWHIRRNSILDMVKIEFPKFLAALKIFELELSFRMYSREANIANDTAVIFCRLVRLCLAELSYDDYKKLSFKRTLNDSRPIITISLIDDKIVIGKDLNHGEISTASAFVSASKLTNDKNQITYHFDYKHSENYREGKYKTFDEIDRFWNYAEDRLVRTILLKGIDLFLLLKEIELRYNSRNVDFWEVLIRKISINNLVAEYGAS